MHNDQPRGLPRAPGPEYPRSEPEIIPPRRGNSSGGHSRIWTSIDDRDGGRVHVVRPGPFSIILALVIIGLVAAAILVVLLGALLIWIPIAILLVAAAFLSGSVRHYWRRLRGQA